MSYKTKNFSCNFCKKEFTRRARNAEFCSISCCNRVKKKGKTPWNKKLFPIECLSCKKVFQPRNKTTKYCSGRCGRIGKNPWNKGIEYLAIRGKNHHNWKGGISKEHHTEREMAMQTVEYKIWRRSVFERDNYTCQLCSKDGVKIEADHIKPWSSYPELRYEINNGRTLCKKCHLKTNTYGYRKLFRKISSNPTTAI